MEADKDDKPSYEAFIAAHTFPYSATSERKDQIAKHYTRLRVGLSEKEVERTSWATPIAPNSIVPKGPG